MAHRVTGSVSVALAALLILVGCGPAAAGPSTKPTPTAKPFDMSPWTVGTIGRGPTAKAANDSLEFFFPATALADPQQQQLIGVNLTSKCSVAGDFDLQVDYSLASWPARNGVRFGLAAGNSHVVRTSEPNGSENEYMTNFAGHLTGVESEDSSGRLRLARVGTTITGYYLANRNWVAIASGSAASDAQPYSIAAWSDAVTFGKRDVRIDLKNFTMTPATAGCV
jgi:hypothetical protein